MDYHLQKLKLDSLRVRIPASKCLNHTVAGRPSTLLTEDDGEIHSQGIVYRHRPRNREELNEKYDSIKFEIQYVKPKNDTIRFEAYWEVVISAKMLGDRYFEGLTSDNISLVHKWYQSHKQPLIFSLDALLNSTILDVDVCYDSESTPDDWKKLIYGIRAEVDIAKTDLPGRGSGYKNRIFDSKKNVGLEFGDRKSSALTKPFIKYYHKGLELMSKSSDWWNRYFPGAGLIDVGRYEITINDVIWQRDGISVRYLRDLLSLDLETIKSKVMKQTKMYFLQTKAVTRKKSSASQTERMVQFVVEDWFKRGGTEQLWLDELERDTEAYGASGTQKGRTKKDIYDYIKAVKTNSPEVIKHQLQSIKVRNMGRDLELWD